MNAWAWAAGAAKTAAATIAAAINFEFMSIILPLKFRREIGRGKPPGQPIQTTHAKVKYACAVAPGACGNRRDRRYRAGVTTGSEMRHGVPRHPPRASKRRAAEIIRGAILAAKSSPEWHELWTSRQANTDVNAHPTMRHRRGRARRFMGQAQGGNRERLGAVLVSRGPIRCPFRYNFILNADFNLTKAIIAASLKLQDYRRRADVRLSSASLETARMIHINPSEHARPVGFGQRKVMPRACVTDGKKHLRTFLSDALEDLGFITSECGPASELPAVLTAQQPDLFVLGVSFDGVEVGKILETLVRKNFTGKVLVIGQPGSIMVKAIRQIGEEYGIAMLPCLQTPFSAGTLRDSVATLLPSEPAPSPAVDAADALKAGWLEFWYHQN